MKTEIECNLEKFKKKQTLTIIGKLRNLGIGLKILKNNKWDLLSEYKLPFERYIILYNDKFEVSDIGIY